MVKNLDTRKYSFSRSFDAGGIELTLRELLLENHIVRIRGVNPFQGSAQQAYSEFTGYDYTARVESMLSDSVLVARAQAHVKEIAVALGFGPQETPEFVADPNLKVLATGQRVVNLQQYHRGVPVFQMERAVWIAPDGMIYNVTGASVGLPAGLEVLPNVNVEQALMAALKFLTWPIESDNDAVTETKASLRIDLEGFKPRILAGFPLPAQPFVMERGPLGEEVPAYLVFFYEGDTTRLGWHFLISTPAIAEQYVMIVEARAQPTGRENPQVLYCQKTSKSLATVTVKVWKNNPEINKIPEPVSFPRPRTDYPIDGSVRLPDDFPLPWIDGTGDKAGNNCTIVVSDDDTQVSAHLPAGLRISLNPKEPRGDEQIVLNALYFCSFLHDFFYVLGFNESAENFQRINPTGEGKDGDPVVARISHHPIEDTARMVTLADGSKALLKVGTRRGTGRHGALDADVMFHEYTHGVTSRLVGSQRDPQPLQRPQSEGMSEGWSDYFALTIQNYYLGVERVIIGNWITDNADGLRGFPYDDGFADTSVGTYGTIRPGSADHSEAHDIGRIWCATLMKINRDLGVDLGDRKKGHLLGWQIVIAGLQLTPANPNYLQGRDAIIQALKDRRRNGLPDEEFQKAYMTVWKAFTLFGMGGKAECMDSGLSGIRGDRDEANIPAASLMPTPTP